MRAVSLDRKILNRIAGKKGDVFLRADFEDLGGYDQIGRALRKLVAAGELLRIGQGLYARTARSPFDGKPIPVKGVTLLMQEALQRVGVEARPTRSENDYNAGKTTQVPTGRVIGVNKRVRRKIGYDGWLARFERA